MPTLQNVEVTIRSTSTGRTLEEYDSPKEPLISTYAHARKYIEAKTDEEFSVEIALKPGFKFHRLAFGIDVYLTIDDGTLVDSLKAFKKPHPGPITGADIRYTISDDLVRRGGRLQSCNFTFGKLRMGKITSILGCLCSLTQRIDEDQTVDNAIVDEQAKTLGTICLEVHQVRREPCSPRVSYRRQYTEPLMEGSRALVKGKRVDHTMQ